MAYVFVWIPDGDKCENCIFKEEGASCKLYCEYLQESEYNDYVTYKCKECVERCKEYERKERENENVDEGVDEEGVDEKRKIKAKFKQIVSRLIDGKMYYEILYIDEKGNSTIGFGSYNIGYVVRWLNECFEI